MDFQMENSSYFSNRHFQAEPEQTLVYEGPHLAKMTLLKQLKNRFHQGLGQFWCWYTNFGPTNFRLLNKEQRADLQRNLNKS